MTLQLIPESYMLLTFAYSYAINVEGKEFTLQKQ